MVIIKIIVFALLMFTLSSCSRTEAEPERTDIINALHDSTVTVETRQIDSGIKQVDYIPPIGTGQSSAGNMKRERKFHIR